ncbi:MAG: bifunctional 5,10-methylenetetrahydrofolate dehydrogenase/5,10-methenyltetrahydrofolate cyclohydrolase [Candidatus Doudnabacteria bacterium]|nr:bifunctional 5,10-methylenetetrahydrofolate dehydrogenase/5,10-methenyltetrahydrofolate cyclohydrolase [Candidatus Doudnabacteria bacterium]
MSEIEGKAIAQTILDSVKERVGKLRRRPTLTVIMVGDSEASKKYVDKKAKAAEYVGIDFSLHRFPQNIPMDQLNEEIVRLQLRADSVMVQLPLPKQINTQEILDSIDPDKDADCLSSAAIGRVARGHLKIIPPTAGAVMEILKDVELEGTHVVVVGQGELVGKAVAAVMLNHPVTMTVCGLGTRKLSDHTKKADILISGTGQANLITADMVKKGAIVIDAGTSYVDGELKGDVDFEKVAKKASLITPVPGGVGPITIAKLLENVAILAEK